MAGTTDLELSSILRIGDLRLTLTADFETGPNPRRVFRAQLGNLTLGAIITYLVHLAEPDFDIELDPPWNALFDINLRNLVLEIDLTNNRIGFQYTGLRVDLPFLSLKQVEVWYSLPSRGASVGKSVDLALFGKLLDQDYTQKPLSWDLCASRRRPRRDWAARSSTWSTLD